MNDVVLASRNAKKVAELEAILGAYGLRVVPLERFPRVGEVEETGATFRDNAALKAEAVCAATGLPTLADDSGLIADAIAPLPGVHSARFSECYANGAALSGLTPDARNTELLLLRLCGLPMEKRTARYCCVIALASPGRQTAFFEGTCEGRILEAPRGDGGFGYDPVFFSNDLGVTFAEATGEAKHAVSHRGRALAAMGAALRSGTLRLT